MSDRLNKNFQATAKLADSIRDKDRLSLSKAITLLESNRDDHEWQSCELLEYLGHLDTRQGIRIGITGAAGVGKSTFIETFGIELINEGLTLAVVAVDPTSVHSGGSILGDKSRMPNLSRNAAAFIRPSPAGYFGGGVSRRSSDVVFVCEQAGYDVVIIETTGSGQTDHVVSEMSDVFILLVAPVGGDELQGIKRGIMELADFVLVNKCDGELANAARKTCSEYTNALHLLRKRKSDPENFPIARTVSAMNSTSVHSCWRDIKKLIHWRKQYGFWDDMRRKQSASRFYNELRELMHQQITISSELSSEVSKIESNVANNKISSRQGAIQAMESINRSKKA